MKWEKLGQIVLPSKEKWWLQTHTGASAVIPQENNRFILVITGRDSKNRSVIGQCFLELPDDKKFNFTYTDNALLSHGELGAFDENGVSYPSIVQDELGKTFMYYTGWMPTVLTPFQNHLGLSQLKSGKFERISRAPIMERNNEDYLSIGSACVLKEKDLWRMWYTSFVKWEGEEQKKHHYYIKYAFSDDGINWKRKNIFCLTPKDNSEYCIAKPTVFKHQDKYHMWFCCRGDQYKIGYAVSQDGIQWNRDDSLAGIAPSIDSWDNESVTYPTVFRHRDFLYMLYSGKNYGAAGLGLARIRLGDLK